MTSEKKTDAQAAEPGAVPNPTPDSTLDSAPNQDAAPAASEPRRRPGWLRLTVIVLFALLYAYDLFEAISDTFGVADQITRYNENATLIGLNTVAIPWTVLVVNMLLPPVVFGLALAVTRRRNLGILAIVLLAGLAVVAAGSLSLTVLAGSLS